MKSPLPAGTVGGSAEPVPDAALRDSKAGTCEGQLVLALQVNAALLTLLANHFRVDQNEPATIEHEGKIVARCTIGEALDMANAALEPKSQQESSVTAQSENTNAPPS